MHDDTRQSRASIAVVDDALFDEHHARTAHPERPERLGAARRALATVGAEVAIRVLDPRDATDAELGRAHAQAHLDALGALDGEEAMIDADTYVARGSIRAARRAAGGAVALVDALLDDAEGPARGDDGEGATRRGIALVRPPGHHATGDEAMGFCLFNNVAVAAHHALARGVSRVAIVDFDVHHGNGTEAIFADDPRVLFLSLHQYPLYPGTGATTFTGRGAGEGFTVNIPLSSGAGDAAYEAAFDEIVTPLLARFAPEIVLVSAGYDGHERDPLAAMKLTEHGYAAMVGALVRAADATAKGRIGLVLEGGYDLRAIEGALVASMRALVAPPARSDVAHKLAARHRGDIDRALAVVARRWELGAKAGG